jgi:hypothetical protein
VWQNNISNYVDEDGLATAVLKSVLGEDPSSLHGNVEVQSAALQEGIEGLVFGIIRDDENKIQASMKVIRFAIYNSVETRIDDFTKEPSDLGAQHDYD